MAYSDRYLLFVEYFNREKFMSAQTTLDEVWLDEVGENKVFYGGLIQLAVSLYHLTNENPKGAKKIFEAAREMLKTYNEVHQGLSLKVLLQDFDDLFTKKVNFDDIRADYRNQLPRIQFKE